MQQLYQLFRHLRRVHLTTAFLGMKLLYFRLMRFFLLLCFLFVLLSCQEKRKDSFHGHALKITENKPRVVNKDSLEPPRIFPVSESQKISLSLDAPNSVKVPGNVFPAGNPPGTSLALRKFSRPVKAIVLCQQWLIPPLKL